MRPVMRTFPIATLFLCGICCLIFLGLATLRGEPSWDAVATWGYLPAARVWDGAYWASSRQRLFI